MKKPILTVLSLIILISVSSPFFNVNKDNGSIDKEVINDLSISDSIVEWSRFWGADQYETGKSLIIDSNGYIYVGGETNSFGTGDYDLFLIKYNAFGDEIWNITIISAGNDGFQALALDSSNNIYILGYSFSGVFPNIDQDTFLFKFNSSGNLLWQTMWGGSDRDYGSDILIDSLDNIYIAGDTNSYGAGSSDVFIIKYNSNGTKLWESIWGGTDSEDCSKIAFDSEENLYITGGTRIGSYKSIYLVKYNNSGSIKWESIWSRGFTGDNSYDMLIDSSDNIYITGSTTYWSSNVRSVVLIKFNNRGDELWWKSWRGISWGYDSIYGEVLALDSVENIYIAGSCTYQFNHDRDVFLIKVDSLGK
ncbi:hypothetical protein LCGC14_1390130 [marine sediment metagenome]|uniref:Bulb-type lectin domain-containing protein n=1 Tax=marine sediment metagenome TaxID=412755 RepID=A0A0F9K075_9ZZZZ